MKLPKLTEKQAWRIVNLNSQYAGLPSRRIQRGVYEEDGEVYNLKQLQYAARCIIREAFHPESIGELEPSQINRILGRKAVKTQK